MQAPLAAPHLHSRGGVSDPAIVLIDQAADPRLVQVSMQHVNHKSTLHMAQAILQKVRADRVGRFHMLGCSSSICPSGMQSMHALQHTCTAVVVPPTQRSCSSIRPPTRNARRALCRSPCRSPMATTRAAAGRNVGCKTS